VYVPQTVTIIAVALGELAAVDSLINRSAQLQCERRHWSVRQCDVEAASTSLFRWGAHRKPQMGLTDCRQQRRPGRPVARADPRRPGRLRDRDNVLTETFGGNVECTNQNEWTIADNKTSAPMLRTPPLRISRKPSNRPAWARAFRRSRVTPSVGRARRRGSQFARHGRRRHP
jgi:hypothetical protein